MITGSVGRLGWNLIQFLLKDKVQISGSFHQARVHANPGVNLYPLNLNNPVQAMTQLQSLPPDLDAIVHCAALSNVDDCEKHPQMAHRINTLGVELLVSAARKQKIPLIYFSTDFVFNGNCGGYTESSAPDPRGVYAKTKLLGEHKALAYSQGVVLRYTPIGYTHRLSHHPPTLVERLIEVSAQNQKMGLFFNKTFSPVSGYEIYCALKALLPNSPKKSKQRIFHICSKERGSIFEVGQEIERQFQLNPCTIPTAWPDNDYSRIRPKHSGLMSLNLPSTPLHIILQRLHLQSNP